MTLPIITVLDSWPQPSSVPEAVVFATETQLTVRYVTADDTIAVIHFPLVRIFQFGSPNDESLDGHPLARFGLKFYSVHKVENSPWISELEERNAVHPQHNKESFLRDSVHYVFTFQDSTLECVALEGKFWSPKIEVCDSPESAKTSWSKFVGDLPQ